MKPPGFTAEASLYQTRGHYRKALTFTSVEGTVQLAQNDCFSNCMDDCIGGPLTTAQCSSSCHHRCSPAPPPPSGPSGPFCHGFYCRDTSYVCTVSGCCPIQSAWDPTGMWTLGQFPYPDPSGQYFWCKQPNGCPPNAPLRCEDAFDSCCPEGSTCTAAGSQGYCSPPNWPFSATSTAPRAEGSFSLARQ